MGGREHEQFVGQAGLDSGEDREGLVHSYAGACFRERRAVDDAARGWDGRQCGGVLQRLLDTRRLADQERVRQ